MGAIQGLKNPKGSSKIAIEAYIKANYKVADGVGGVSFFIKKALKSGVAAGWLVQKTGQGVSGSFKVGKVEKPKPKKKPAAKKAPAKKAPAKKSPAKKTATPAKKKAAPKKKKTPAKKAKTPTKKAAPKKQP